MSNSAIQKNRCFLCESISFIADVGTVTCTIKDGIVNIDVDGTVVHFANEKADVLSIGALTLTEALSQLEG